MTLKLIPLSLSGMYPNAVMHCSDSNPELGKALPTEYPKP